MQMTPKICDHLDACSECYARIKKAMDIVQEQAENESLWFKSVYVTETILQSELRRLHATIDVGDG